MPRTKTRFEQVPLGIIKKIAEEEIQRKKTTEGAQGTKQKSGRATAKGEV
jgi:hypothetical protein